MNITREQYEADIRKAKEAAHDEGYADGYFDAKENAARWDTEPLAFTPNPYREES